MKKTKHALILFAHGSRNPQWADPFKRIRDQLASKHPESSITLAYWELMEPNLEKAIGDLVDQNVGRITLIPLFMAQGGHLKEDLPKLIADIQRRHSDLVFNIMPPIGEVDTILYAIAEWASQVFVENDLR